MEFRRGNGMEFDWNSIMAVFSTVAKVSFLAKTQMIRLARLVLCVCIVLEGLEWRWSSSVAAFADSIVCDSGTIVLTSGVARNISCTNVVRSPTITPSLPQGLYFANGQICGTPTEGSPMTMYTIVSRQNYGTFSLGGFCSCRAS